MRCPCARACTRARPPRRGGAPVRRVARARPALPANRSLSCAVPGPGGMAPFTDATRGMMNRDFFDAVKPGAIFVNGRCGAPVDENALLSFAEQRPFCEPPEWTSLCRSLGRGSRRCAHIRAHPCLISDRRRTKHDMPWPHWRQRICCQLLLANGRLPCTATVTRGGQVWPLPQGR